MQAFNQAKKSKALQQYFQQQGRIHVVVDARRDDVILPDFLKGDPALRLVLNCRMPHPIHFFPNRIESQFSFSGVLSQCVIPLAAIWSAYPPELSMEEGLMWETDIPDVILATFVQMDAGVTASEGQVQEEDVQEVVKEDVQGVSKRAHLRVVK